jgi:crotonobetainyl-CoA:carnitine CoA-transferase CaiB-like acyl-CoA transferase
MHMSAEAFLNPAYEVYDSDHNPPLKLPGHSGDFLCGLVASICTMSGIFAQKATGIGQHIDLSQQEALACMICHEVGDYYDSGITYLRDRKHRWENSPKYPCKDGFIMMNIPFQFWESVIEMMGSPEWARNQAYKTPVGLHSNWKEIQPRIIEWMKQHTVAEVEKAAKAKRLDISIVYSAKEVADLELFAAREFFVEVDHKAAGKIKFPGAPVKFSSTPAKTPHPAPLLGEHNAEVYCQMLGHTADNLVKMKQTGTV